MADDSQATSFNDLEEDQIQASLYMIQELFYTTSDFKDGPDAGKLNLVQFEEGKPAVCLIRFSFEKVSTIQNKLSEGSGVLPHARHRRRQPHLVQ